MLKGQIPYQAMSNKLEIFNWPGNLASVTWLKRVSVAKRTLFKKIAIMTKRQSPKIRGTVS